MNGKVLKKEFGDYQTPINFAYNVCLYIDKYLKLIPNMIIEPTCGQGNFIKASMDIFKKAEKIYGVEVNEKYCNQCKESIKDEKVRIICDNYFDFRADELIADENEILVIGNPPWATNSKLKFNLPRKVNFKKLSGIEALTGASNFDICEYIILKILDEFKNTNTTVAMLCKTSVARNVFTHIAKNEYSSEYVKILNFDAEEVFGITASACLLLIKISCNKNICDSCQISDFKNPDEIKNIIVYKNGMLLNQSNQCYDFAGKCQFEWRQGVKHDCSGVMELTKSLDNLYQNKNKEIIELENDLIFPLVKSSGFKKAVINNDFDKYVIVTQKKARQETTYISQFAPMTWRYLSKNKQLFDDRKSSIYHGAPAFSMFGVGDYSYAKYKVGVSGFYKKPLFSLLYNEKNLNKSIMLDDTSYFISFEDYDLAYVCMLLLNSDKVQEFLSSISFRDAKRPYTKKVLQKIDFIKCIEEITIKELICTEELLGIDRYITDELYYKAKTQIRSEENEQISMIL